MASTYKISVRKLTASLELMAGAIDRRGLAVRQGGKAWASNGEVAVVVGLLPGWPTDAVVDGGKLIAVLRAMAASATDEDEVTLSQTPSTLQVRASGVKMTIRTLADMPPMPAELKSDGASVRINAGQLVDAVSRVEYAAASNLALNAVLMGIHITLTGTGMTLTTTDSFRAATSVIKSTRAEGTYEGTIHNNT